MHVSADERVGTELAGYRIESLLGWGGMSVVYLAEDLRLKRRVALKLLAPELAGDAAFRDRFLRESELAASIDHPNIVPIYEAGTTGDGRLFIAMRYVDGRDLRTRLRRGRLGASEAIGVLAQLASALDAAHARGLVHRDVKPSNVLLDRGARPDGSDHVYLADFGITRRAADEAAPGDDAPLLGTIDYVAPEGIEGGDVDGRADVYSLGCLLYECLVGEPPFRRDSELAVAFAHLSADPPAPSERRPELPAALDEVVARALAKDPGARFETCRALARAALAVSVDEASRRVGDVAARAAAGRSGLSEAEAELAGTVADLQLAREQERALAAPAGRARPAAPPACPFKGLAGFEPSDADAFFGRERLVAELVARLAGAPFLAIVGPSGSGKSSVLRAGLLPALAGGVLPGSDGWRRLLLRPGEHPLDALRQALAPDAPDPVAHALDALAPGARLLLAVDQLEELFTACRSEAERAAFADVLARAAADPAGRAVVVAALRADFYGRFSAHPALAELLGGNGVLVGPMRASELRRAVELPAALAGLRVERELSDALVDDVEGRPGALPLLSTALLELWRARSGDTLTLEAYRASGGVQGAVARLAERTYARVPEARRGHVRAIMLRLVGEDEGAVPVRRRAPLAELDLERDPDTAEVLATLAGSRLVTVGDGVVEVAHEALLGEWPRLRDWIEEDAAGRRLHRHLTRAAGEWEAAGREPAELYRGARLAAALDWSAERGAELNDVERAFVAASREAAEREAGRARRTNRRLRALLAGVAALLAVSVAAGVVAALQRADARGAETAQLAQRLGAQALVEDELDLSLLLARQALAVDDTPHTRGFLLEALLRTPAVAGIAHGAGRSLAVSPDGSTLAVGGEALRLYDARTLEQVAGPIAGPAPWVDAVAFSPDGRTLAFGGETYVALLDARSHVQLTRVRTDANTARLLFTHDGARLVAVESVGERGLGWISFRDAGTLRPVAAPLVPDGFAGSYVSQQWTHPGVALTPDGRSLLVAAAGELVVWDLLRRERTRAFAIPRGHHALALDPRGRTAAIGVDGGIRLVDLRTGGTTDGAGASSSPTWLAFGPDGRTVASTHVDGTVTLWDARDATPSETLRGHSRAVWQPAFGPDGRTLYTAGGDGIAIAWALGPERRLARPFRFTRDGTNPWPDRHPGELSPDGRLLAVGLKAGGVELRDTEHPDRPGWRLSPTGGEVDGLAFSADGRMLAAVGAGGTTIWDVPSRMLRHGPLPAPGASVAIGPDGTLLAVAGPDGVTLWDAGTGARRGRLGDRVSVGDVAFDPTGRLLALVREGRAGGGSVDGGGDAEVWDVERGARVAAMTVDTVLGPAGSVLGWAVAFSPDGRTLATGGLDPLVRLWDVETGALVREIEQNVGTAVWSLEFGPGGDILAMSGGDPFASLWDVATGTQIGPRLAAGTREAMLDLSADGRRLLVTNGDGAGAVWEIDPGSWPARACALANRALTREEWSEFLPGRPYEPACPG